MHEKTIRANTLRVMGALIEQYAKDVVKNPGLLVCCLFPVLFVILFVFLIADAPRNEGALAYLLAFSLVLTTSMVPATASLYPIAEEKETHALRTLELAGVTRSQMLAARGIVAVIFTAAAMAGCGIALGIPAADIVVCVILGAAASLPLTVLSLLLGLITRNQMSASFHSFPIIIIGLAPLVLSWQKNISYGALLLPTGGEMRLIELLANGSLFTTEALVPLALALAWILISLIAALALIGQLARKEN